MKEKLYYMLRFEDTEGLLIKEPEDICEGKDLCVKEK